MTVILAKTKNIRRTHFGCFYFVHFEKRRRIKRRRRLCVCRLHTNTHTQHIENDHFQGSQEHSRGFSTYTSGCSLCLSILCELTVFISCSSHSTCPVNLKGLFYLLFFFHFLFNFDLSFLHLKFSFNSTNT